MASNDMCVVSALDRGTKKKADPKAGLISYVSPLAKSLMGKEVGERLPFGGQSAEIIALVS